MALRRTWPSRTLAEGGGPGGHGSGPAGRAGGLVGSRLLMRHLRGGWREQPAAEHAAEQADELLTRRVRQPVPELVGANGMSLPRRGRGGTSRLEGSDM